MSLSRLSFGSEIIIIFKCDLIESNADSPTTVNDDFFE